MFPLNQESYYEFGEWDNEHKIELVSRDSVSNVGGAENSFFQTKFKHEGAGTCYNTFSTISSLYSNLVDRPYVLRNDSVIISFSTENVIYFLPPYCITEQELRNAYEIVAYEIQGVTA